MSAAYIEGMPINAPALAHLSDRDLVATVTRLVACANDVTADLIAALAELDTRRLYLSDGCASLFSYCTERLYLSESAAYHRITAARAARRFPVILDRLREGALTLTAVGLLAPHLTEANYRHLLDAARHQGKRTVESLIARLHARPDVCASIRKLPSPRASLPERTESAAHLHAPPNGGSRADEGPLVSASLLAAADAGILESRALPIPHRPAVIEALAPARFQVRVTVSAETHAKLRRAQDLLRHVIPDGDPAAVLDRALTVLLDRLERSRCAAANSPRSAVPAKGRQPQRESRTRSRTIPAGVRRAVWERDGGRCTFVGASGRCKERGFLEFHHRVPFAAGGEATVENVALLCRAHNAHEAWRDFPVALESAASVESPGEVAGGPRSTASGGS